MNDDSIDRLVAEIKGGKKYRHMAPTLIHRVGTRELLHRRNFKDAVKATKNKLHQVGGAYMDIDAAYQRWMKQLRDAKAQGHESAFLRACQDIMARHTSTRERLPDLDRFYDVLFKRVGRVQTVIDLACGLNPLAFPWMPLPPEARYYAFDIYQDMTDFLDEFFVLAPVNGHAGVADLGAQTPSVQADVAFLFKILPCIEQIDKGRSLALMSEINAPNLFVSFPSRSLGGRGKGMADNYDQQFRSLVSNTGWAFERLDFPREIVFHVTK